MKTKQAFFLALILSVALTVACGDDDTGTSVDDGGATLDELPAAFEAFDQQNTTIMLDGYEIIIESNGLPNHTSPYWSNTTERTATDPRGTVLTTPAATENHPLFSEPTATSYEQMAPGNIDDFNGSYTLIVPAIPQKTTPSATSLGAIGIAVSGAMIYNDEEGPNVPLDNAVGSLDYNGAHTGPQSYHYHLEPIAFSNDDDNLIAIMGDGFFLYGRRDDAEGNYPTDLDESGGHFGPTKYNPDGEYHYHVQNELYLNQYYILFPGNYQWTPNAIN